MWKRGEDRWVPARVKRKIYKTIVRPAMLYDLETVALTTVGGARGGRIEDRILIRSDKEGQDPK